MDVKNGMAAVFLGLFVAGATYDVTLRTEGALPPSNSLEYTMALVGKQLRLCLFDLDTAREYSFVIGGQEYRLIAIPNLFG